MHLPLPASLQDPASRSALGWAFIRLTLAGLIAAHGWARLIAGGVTPFGVWIDGQGFAFGLGIAMVVTVYEIVGTVFLALGKLVFPLTLVYAAIYAVGIVLVHAPAGWFVFGLGRRSRIQCATCHLPALRWLSAGAGSQRTLAHRSSRTATVNAPVERRAM